MVGFEAASSMRLDTAKLADELSLSMCLQDKVFFTALIKSLPATVSVQSGGKPPTSFQATKTGLNHSSQPFNVQNGAVIVTIGRNGAAAVQGSSRALMSSPRSGNADYNAWVGSALA
ncbi:glycoside hydrolase family 71 protein [Trematosphaeria pertusa]|uniref:Glycoside hydrolase family 71 protein n=1 Tax=Trematosphaeria pertusa TaxID=390896 RepID=A0A6A6J2W0_9PLEO|nr:glycoside hydrolase family 71 protein [Trematosphaeria pertusa]KAF2256552.1 glycoside hydrolase family 71 protein [Trematosphaeria pertusa]